MKKLILLLLVIIGCNSKKNAEIKKNNVYFSYSILKGLEPENVVTRRDPSDVIKVVTHITCVYKQKYLKYLVATVAITHLFGTQPQKMVKYGRERSNSKR